ncbi:hypothetical protein KDW46_25675 [Burkholderia vietnamiensis]|uniref:hypothetical protein n=1 Tax=Burkholderia latens TaxID=488446 RepID=UPI001B93F4BF|nr:hypothetical protein [Burkholderia latens]MBR8145751.1 hypothetical protein [Burkholderia vietnamiensis]MBY4697950.1 hypothetical protein [Burkholderia latens]
MASPEEGPGNRAARFANDRAMTAHAPQSGNRAIALRDVRNDDGRDDGHARPRLKGREYTAGARAAGADTEQAHAGAIVGSRRSFAIKMRP